MKTDPSELSPLFDRHRELRAVIDAVLEGRLGAAFADSTEHATAARLDLGCYSIFGGDPQAPAAEELIAGVEPPRELIDVDAVWRSRLLRVHRDRLQDRPMRAFVADGLDAEHLSRLTDVASGYRLDRLDANGARQLDSELIPHALQTYGDAEAFAAAGLGFGAFVGDRLVCAATSYARTSSRVEIAIATRPGHRGRGLATAAAARLVLECVESDLEPCLNAGNPVSQRLAKRLGFRPAGICEVLFLG